MALSLQDLKKFRTAVPKKDTDSATSAPRRMPRPWEDIDATGNSNDAQPETAMMTVAVGGPSLEATGGAAHAVAVILPQIERPVVALPSTGNTSVQPETLSLPSPFANDVVVSESESTGNRKPQPETTNKDDVRLRDGTPTGNKTAQPETIQADASAMASNGSSTGNSIGANRKQQETVVGAVFIQPETVTTTTGNNQDSNRKLNRKQEGTALSPTARVGEDVHASLLSTGNIHPIVSGSDESRFRLNDVSFPDAVTNNGTQLAVVSGEDHERFRLNDSALPVNSDSNRKQMATQPETASTPVTGNKSPSERTHRSAQQRQILAYLIAAQESTGLGHTAFLSRAQIAAALQLKPTVLKVQVQRLEWGGDIIRKEARDGRYGGGTVYQVPKETIRRFGTFQPETSQSTGNARTGNGGAVNREQQPETMPPVSSSSERSITTTNAGRAFAEKLQLVCDRNGLGEHSVGANDLLMLWRKGTFTEEQDLLDSIEHIAFYLTSDQAKGITHPKAWMLKTLAQGFYPPPSGFKSWEQRQAEARIAAKQARLAQLRETRRKELETDFELWLAELPDKDKRRLLAGTPVADSPSGMAARSMLKEIFMKEQGVDPAALEGV